MLRDQGRLDGINKDGEPEGRFRAANPVRLSASPRAGGDDTLAEDA